MPYPTYATLLKRPKLAAVHAKAPRLQSLIDEGLIDTVVRQLMSGKEAMVCVVRCGDVANLKGFFGQFAPELLKTHYGDEIWNLYERGELHTASDLTGAFVRQFASKLRLRTLGPSTRQSP